MSGTFKLEISTPTRSFFSGEVQMVILKTMQGEIGILKNHMPIVVAVVVGPVKIKDEKGEWLEAVVSEGFMKVRENDAVMLVDTAEWPEEIDINRAREAKVRAQEKLMRQLSNVEYLRTVAALTRAMERLKIKGHR